MKRKASLGEKLPTHLGCTVAHVCAWRGLPDSNGAELLLLRATNLRLRPFPPSSFLPNVTSLTRVLIGGGGSKQINRHRFNSLLSSARLLAEVVRVNISILHSSWEATFRLCSDSSAEDGTRRLTLPISAKGHAAFMGAIKTCSCQERRAQKEQEYNRFPYFSSGSVLRGSHAQPRPCIWSFTSPVTVHTFTLAY